MKITELIKYLNELKQKHGDIECYVDKHWADRSNVRFAKQETTKDGRYEIYPTDGIYFE